VDYDLQWAFLRLRTGQLFHRLWYADTTTVECATELTTPFFFLDLKAKKATLFDGGANPFHTTTLASVAQSVVGVLTHPSATENKAVRIHDFFITQRDVLSMLEAELGPFTVQDVAVRELADRASAGLACGEVTEANIYALVQTATFGMEGSSACWPEDDDSAFLGLPKRDLKAEIKKVLATL